MDYAKESLRLHAEWKGKIEMISRVPVKDKQDLSLAYTPGVAQPCIARTEKGATDPKLSTLLKMLEPLGLTLSITSI